MKRLQSIQSEHYSESHPQKMLSSSLFKHPFNKQNIVSKLKKGKLFRLTQKKSVNNKAQIIYQQQIDQCKLWLKNGLFYNAQSDSANQSSMGKSTTMGQTYFYLNTNDIASIKQKQKNHNLPTLILKQQKNNQKNDEKNYLHKSMTKFNTKSSQGNGKANCSSFHTQIKKTSPKLNNQKLCSFQAQNMNQHKKVCYQKKLKQQIKQRSLIGNNSFCFINQQNYDNSYKQPIRLSPKATFLRDKIQNKKNSRGQRNNRNSLRCFYKSTKQNSQVDDLKRVRNFHMSTKPFFKNLKILQKKACISCYDELSYILKQFPNCQNMINKSQLSSNEKKSKNCRPTLPNVNFRQQKQNYSVVPTFLLKSIKFANKNQQSILQSLPVPQSFQQKSKKY